MAGLIRSHHPPHRLHDECYFAEDFGCTLTDIEINKPANRSWVLLRRLT